jgi:hypothetical protein
VINLREARQKIAAEPDFFLTSRRFSIIEPRPAWCFVFEAAGRDQRRSALSGRKIKQEDGRMPDFPGH